MLQHRLALVPPAPNVIAQLYANYKRSTEGLAVSFADYLQIIGFTGRKECIENRDKGHASGIDLVAIPKNKVSGQLRILVLLVDFADNIGNRPTRQYEDMLFSTNTYLTGSLTEFYREVSGGKVEVTGSVHGWLRMPHPYNFYVNKQSGTGPYPNNAQRLTEDALAAALQAGVAMPADLDKFGNGTITGLFIVHAGPGAEVMPSVSLQAKHIWSHKADLPDAVEVAANLFAVNYLTVPENCLMGVCAHELGHLAFQWDDFYDPDYEKNGEWAGAGNWDLMAGGSWNDGGNTPAHPAGLHKVQHGWAEVATIKSSVKDIVLPPFGQSDSLIVRVQSQAFTATQSLLLENRVRNGFDAKLPGEGLLVWRVDTDLEMNQPDAPAMLLLQADGKHQLETPNNFNTGDAGDPFPGSGMHDTLRDTGTESTSFPGQQRSGITLHNIRLDPQTRNIILDIDIQP